MEECLFCKIRDNKIRSQMVYENDIVFAFLDIHPVNLGHTLVCPREHYKTILDIPEIETGELIQNIQDISKAVLKATGAKGFNLMVNTNRVSGQLIEHAHFHIIPRFENDGLRHWPKRDISKEDMDNIQEKIKKLI